MNLKKALGLAVLFCATAVHADLTNGLVAYYPFNGNANDASGKGNDGTVHGAILTSDRFGIPNSAYSMDGTSFIQIPDTIFGPTVQAVTISLWIITGNGPFDTWQELFCKGSQNGEMGMNITSGKVHFLPSLAGYPGPYEATAPVLSNSVMHLVGVYQRGQTVSLYTNGVFASSTNVPDANLSATSFPVLSALGMYDYTPGPYAGFHGNIDDVRIYNRALSGSEIQQLYALEASPANLSIGLVAYYPFNGNPNDMAGANDGVSYGATLTTDRFGNPNFAYHFNGSSSYIQTVQPMQDLTTATFSLWFDADTIEDLATLLSDSDAAVANDCVIQFRSLNSLGFYGDKNGVPLNPTTITNGIVTSNWLHIVWVMTPTNQQIYVNGVQATNAAVAANDVGYHWNGLVIGAAYIGPITWYFNGSIDEIRIYNRALSSDEVQQLYAFEAIPQNCIGQAATATAIVVNGFLVGINITGSGCGYTNTPSLRIFGGGGTNAEAVAVVSNGVVVAVNVLDAGSGYTNTPVIVIAPPFIPQPTMGIAAMSLISFSNLAVGTNYQLQSFFGGTLLNVGAAFTAAGSTFTQYVSGTASTDSYRLAVLPVPTQAKATAQVVNDFVVGATVTSGGSGYTNNPAVTIVGGSGGSNATAIATVNGGAVTGITITSAGIGYATAPTIVIAPPPATTLRPNNVTQAMELHFGSLSPYDNYQLEFTPIAGEAWSNLGIPFTSTSTTSTQTINVSGNAGFFRVRFVP